MGSPPEPESCGECRGSRHHLADSALPCANCGGLGHLPPTRTDTPAGSPPEPDAARPRPRFSITFEFTDFEGGIVQRDALAESIFDMLAEGNYRLVAGEIALADDPDVDEDVLNEGWSIDAYEVGS